MGAEGARTWGLCLVTLVLGGVGCGDDASGQAWEPPVTTSESDDDGSEDGPGMDSGDTDDEASCSPGELEPCLCPDGLSLGEHECEADGAGFGACECEGEGSTGDPMPPLPAEVCYLGPDRAGTTCLPLVAFYQDLPEGYEYPPPMRGDGQDRPPLAMIDVSAASGSLSLAPNFVLDELAQPAVGQWAVIQPHAVASLQAMRNAAGPIGVVTGYLSPSANAAAGGETYARHQYGDGFDLDPLDTSLGVLADLCTGEGGSAVEYATHIHCDLSAAPLDESFFGPPPGAAPPGLRFAAGEHDAWIEPDGLELWAPASGFEEGEPRRQWTAYGAAGGVLARHEGRHFSPPPGAAEVEVLVGGIVLRAITLTP